MKNPEYNYYPDGTDSPKLGQSDISTISEPPKIPTSDVSFGGLLNLMKNGILKSKNFVSGVVGWRINADGTFEFNPNPANSRCRAYINADKTITFGSPQKILFDTESYDNSSEFDSTTNNRFVATNAGTYLINSICQFDPNAADTLYVLYIYKNNASISRKVEYPNTTAIFSMQITDIVSLAAGDYIEIFIDSGEGSNFTAKGGSAFTFLNIQRVA